MPFPLTVVLVAIPTFLYMRLVRLVDRRELEPRSYLILTFLWGALPAVILAVIVGVVLQGVLQTALGETLVEELIETAFATPIVEEAVKALAVAFIFTRRRYEFDGWVDGIVYGSTVGFGFAFVENILYIAGTESLGEWVTLFFLRVVIFGFMHGFWTSLTGIGFGIARNLRSRILQVLVVIGGYSAAVLGHALHNGPLVLAQDEPASLLVAVVNYLILIGLMVSLTIIASRNERTLLVAYLRDEVPSVITPKNYTALCSTVTSAQAHWRLLPPQRRLFVQTATELAQKKWQREQHGEERGNTALITQLQADLQRMQGL